MSRLEAWVVQRSAAIIAILAVVIAALSVLTVLLLVGEANIEKRLGPPDKVQVAAPCRTLGPDAKECRRQSRLIVKSCLTHKPCRKLVVRLTSGPHKLSQSDGPADPQGGDASTPPPSTGSSQPGPPSGGPPGGNGNPPAPKPDEPGLLDPVLDPACDVTKPLGLC